MAKTVGRKQVTIEDIVIDSRGRKHVILSDGSELTCVSSAGVFHDGVEDEIQVSVTAFVTARSFTKNDETSIIYGQDFA